MPVRVHRTAVERLPQDLAAQWASVSTTIAADLFRGRTLVDPAIRPIRPFAGRQRLCGSVVTALCEHADYGCVHHAIAVARPDDVILIEVGGRTDAAVIGELLSGSARLRGVLGVCVNGAVRDVGTLSQWGDFAVFARGITPRGPSSFQHGQVNAPISFGGAQVAPGDLILGDDDGLVVIPHRDAQAQLQAALDMVRAEEAWEAELATGKTTLEVFAVPPAEYS